MDFIVPKPGRLWKNRADFFRPFKNAAANAGENIIPLYDPNLHLTDVEDDDLRDLNTALAVLIEIFPDVQPEVFREMLSSLGEESRLQVVTEHLLQRKTQWVQGRFRVPPKRDSRRRGSQVERGDMIDTGKNKNGTHAAHDQGLRRLIPTTGPPPLTEEDRFRSDRYKQAVKQVLYQEFKSLSHSTVKAVLAEHNFSYALARPILQAIWTKSWRQSLSNFWSRRSPAMTADDHPYIVWGHNDRIASGGGGNAAPVVKRTGCLELDQELHDLFVAPVLVKQTASQMQADHALAAQLNSAEADEAAALFDCECCYSSTSFEEIAVCDDGCHVLCLDCIQRTVKEALYGQGWAATIDLPRATVACFAPDGDGCRGCISVDLVQRALTRNDTEGEGLWSVFQSRIINENMTQSQLPLRRCPFCSYAEADEIHTIQLKHPLRVWRHFKTAISHEMHIHPTMVLLAMPLLAVPLLIVLVVIVLLVQLVPGVKRIFRSSLHRILKRRHGLKFRCYNPTCSQLSCIQCLVAWQDPHSCFESEATSLRTAIEASATMAVKRTCPRCMLSFVKSSGCNKLVCNCGYIMCYICRQEITPREGYMHFCQHFRPNGGRCDECDRCDLYGDEDEAKAIEEATKEAEAAWQEKQGREGENEQAAKLMMEALVGQQVQLNRYDRWMDFVLDASVA